MPASALKYVDVDHCVPLREMGALLAALAGEAAPLPAGVLAPLAHEHALTLSEGEPMEHLEAIAKPSMFVCPDCQGGLWELVDAQPVRYRCHTGHGYTLRTLRHAQSEMTDGALWSAIRALQEQRMLLEKMAAEERDGGNAAEAALLEAQAAQLERQGDQLRELVQADPQQ